MPNTIIFTKEAPAPIGPYSQAVLAGNTLYVSGQIALDAETGDLINENITEETHAVMKNLEADDAVGPTHILHHIRIRLGTLTGFWNSPDHACLVGNFPEMFSSRIREPHRFQLF